MTTKNTATTMAPAEKPAAQPAAKPPAIVRQGSYLDLGGLWVRYDCIGTIKQVDDAQGAYCQVVLTLPGYKTLGVGCTADQLIDAIRYAERHNEVMIGVQRAKGMRA